MRTTRFARLVVRGEQALNVALGNQLEQLGDTPARVGMRSCARVARLDRAVERAQQVDDRAAWRDARDLLDRALEALDRRAAPRARAGRRAGRRRARRRSGPRRRAGDSPPRSRGAPASRLSKNDEVVGVDPHERHEARGDARRAASRRRSPGRRGGWRSDGRSARMAVEHRLDAAAQRVGTRPARSARRRQRQQGERSPAIAVSESSVTQATPRIEKAPSSKTAGTSVTSRTRSRSPW